MPEGYRKQRCLHRRAKPTSRVSGESLLQMDGRRRASSIDRMRKMKTNALGNDLFTFLTPTTEQLGIRLNQAPEQKNTKRAQLYRRRRVLKRLDPLAHLARVLVTSLAPHERLPEILVVPREKTPTGAAARGNP